MIWREGSFSVRILTTPEVWASNFSILDISPFQSMSRRARKYLFIGNLDLLRHRDRKFRRGRKVTQCLIIGCQVCPKDPSFRIDRCSLFEDHSLTGTNYPGTVRSKRLQEGYLHRLANRLLQRRVLAAHVHSHDRPDKKSNPMRDEPQASRVAIVSPRLRLPALFQVTRD